MGRFCTQCGKETGGAELCPYCGAPAGAAPAPPRKGVSLPQGVKPPPKRGGLTALAFVLSSILLTALAVSGTGCLFKGPADGQPVSVTDAYVTTGPVTADPPVNMPVITPDTATVALYGKADHLKDDAIVELQWIDETGGGAAIGATTATVDAKQGVFYSTYQMPADPAYELVFSGDYRVDVYVDGAEVPAYAAQFSVKSDSQARIASDIINDAYMVVVNDDGSCRPVSAYPEGTRDMALMLSFARMDPSETGRVRWLYKEGGEWVEVEANAGFSRITGSGGARLYYCEVSREEGWPAGEYQVEVYLGSNPEHPSAAVNYRIEGEAAVTGTPDPAGDAYIGDIVLTTGIGENGYPVDQVTSYVLGTDTFYAGFYVGGVTRPAVVTWEWHDETGLLSAPGGETMEKDAYYSIQYGGEDGQPFKAGEYRLVLYIDGVKSAEAAFTVEESVGLDAGSEPLTPAEWAGWNDWLMTFTEGRLAPFDGTPRDSDLIDFAVLYNYLYNEEMYATLDEYGVYWLDESALEYTLWWFLDAEVTHATTDHVLYDSGSYGYRPPDEEMPFLFPQVRGIYREESSVYAVDFDLYTAPVGFTDFNGDYESWQEGEIVPQYLGEGHARVRWVTEEGIPRRVLEGYWEE